jgi:hypothetical protein
MTITEFEKHVKPALESLWPTTFKSAEKDMWAVWCNGLKRFQAELVAMVLREYSATQTDRWAPKVAMIVARCQEGTFEWAARAPVRWHEVQRQHWIKLRPEKRAKLDAMTPIQIAREMARHLMDRGYKVRKVGPDDAPEVVVIGGKFHLPHTDHIPPEEKAAGMAVLGEALGIEGKGITEQELTDFREAKEALAKGTS